MEKSSTKTQMFLIGISFIAALFLNIFLAKDEWLMLLKQNSRLHPERLAVGQKNVVFFNPLVDMADFAAFELSNTEKILKNHIQKERGRIDELQALYEEYSNLLGKYSKDSFTENDLNPLTSYLLIKKLIRNWEVLIKQIAINGNNQQMIGIIQNARIASKIKYPDYDDLIAAAISLLNIQQIYQMNPKELLNEFDNEQEWTLKESAEIAIIAFIFKDYLNWREWSKIVLSECCLNKTTNWQPEILAFLNKLGKVDGSTMRMSVKLIQMASGNGNGNETSANSNARHCKRRQKFEKDDGLVKNNSSKNGGTSTDEKSKLLREWENYKQLCRGNGIVSNSSKLLTNMHNCHLKMDKPFLKLAPLKMEILHLDPLIVLYHEVISNKEIETIKKLATPKLSRATVLNADGKSVYAPYRITKTTFLGANEHPAIAQLNRRIGQMTNLNMESAFDMKVFKYPIGGHYTPHYDFTQKTKDGKDPFDLDGTKGNIMATCLFYLSQPTKGGRTVFTELGLSFAPSKNDALFWYNLHTDGQGDLRTKHSGCPVIAGEKWIFTKLINERGQEWIRPCGIDMDNKVDEVKNLIGD